MAHALAHPYAKVAASSGPSSGPSSSGHDIIRGPHDTTHPPIFVYIWPTLASNNKISNNKKLSNNKIKN